MTGAQLAAAILRTATPAANLSPGVAPMGRQWGTVISIQTGPPQTVTITLAGSNVPIAGVRFKRSYAPVGGDTVLVDHVGTDIVVDDALSGAAPAVIAWTAVTYTNSWATYADPAAYLLVGSRLWFRGQIKTGAFGTSAFNLPPGFRPPGHPILDVYCWGNVLGSVTINSGTAGNFVPSGPAGGNKLVSLDGKSVDLTV